MKKVLSVAFVSSLTLVQIFGAENPDQLQASKSKSKAPAPVPHVAPKVQRNVPTAAIPPKAPNPNVAPKPRIQPNADAPRPVNKIAPVSVPAPPYSQPDMRPRPKPPTEQALQPSRKPDPVPATLPPNRQSDAIRRPVPGSDDNQSGGNNAHNPNRRHRDRSEWSNRSPRISWEQACHRHERRHHHHDWWRNHFTRFVVFGTGYYFWDAGYWYPAYGYDVSYDTYAYEQPIASYGDLEPGQVVANVQAELQRLGYYEYEVDGLMGPETQAALAAYQRDYGLEETSAIDEPTLISLGFIEPGD